MGIPKSSLRRVTIVTPDGVKHHRVPYLILPSILRNCEELHGGTFTLFCLQHDPEPFFDSRMDTLKDIEATVIRKALAENAGNKTATAKALGISRTTLHMKIKTYGIKVSAKVA